MGSPKILSGGYKDGQMAKHITQNDIVEVNHFVFQPKKKQTHALILHAVDFCDAASRIIIRADDTDILVLLLFLQC